VTYVQGHKVKYSHRNYSVADCSTSLKFGIEFRHVTACVQGQRAKVKFTVSKVKVTALPSSSSSMNKTSGRYVRYKQWNTIKERDIGWPTLNLAPASHLKRKMTDSVSGGLKLQCIATATFSSRLFSSLFASNIWILSGQAKTFGQQVLDIMGYRYRFWLLLTSLCSVQQTYMISWAGQRFRFKSFWTPRHKTGIVTEC